MAKTNSTRQAEFRARMREEGMDLDKKMDTEFL